MADWWHNNVYYMTIMKNRITTTITTMMLMLFCSSINIFAQSENAVPSGYLPQISLFEIYFRTREIYVYDDINKTINERKIAEIKTPFIAESTLMCFLRNIETGGRCTGFTNGSKYKVNGKNFTLNELLKQHQKGEKQ